MIQAVEDACNLILDIDDRGAPMENPVVLQTGLCLDGTCKRRKAALYWDALGRSVRFEYPKGTPFTKRDHEAFGPEANGKLESFLKDKHSILGPHPLDIFAAEEPDAASKEIDAVTHATPPDGKAAAVEGAAYTTRVSWHRVNGEIVDQLLRAAAEDTTHVQDAPSIGALRTAFTSCRFGESRDR